MIYLKEISVDISGRQDLASTIYSKQGDGGMYYIKVHIMNGKDTVVLNPAEVRAVLSARKPDKKIVLDDTPEHVTINEDGSVTLMLTSTMQEVAGDERIEIIILDADNNQITTATFINCIVPRAVSNGDVLSSEVGTLLQTLITQASTTYENLQQYADVASVSATAAAAARDAALAAQDELEASVSDINDLKVANAVAEKRISEIERSQASANPNGEPRISISGYGSLTIPKNAAQGSMLGVVNGMTLTNLVTNGATEQNILPTAQYQGWDSKINNYAQLKEHILYFTAELKVGSTNVVLLLNDGIGQTKIAPTVTGQYARVSGLRTISASATDLYIRMQDDRISGWTTSYWKNRMVIDLTAHGLSALTAAQCDLMTSLYFNGTRSASVTRLRSVGKNLINSNTISKGFLNVSNGTLITTSGFTSDYINIAHVSTVTTAMTISSCRHAVGYYDSAKVFISCESWYGTATKTYTRPSTAVYARLSVVDDAATPRGTLELFNLTNPQLEKGSTATTYESYRSSSVYLEPLSPGGVSLPMNRLPNNVCDSYDLLTRAHTQRVKQYVLTANDIIQLYTSGTNVDVVHISYNNLTGISIPPATETYGTSIMTTISAPRNGISSWDTTDMCWRHNQSNTAFIIHLPKSTYANLAAAKTALTGAVIYYQLTEVSCIVTQNAVTGNVLSYPGGTVLFEKSLPDAGYYDGGITISRAGYPIGEIEAIKKPVTVGTTTELIAYNPVTAVINAGKTGFTHPDLVGYTGVLFFDYKYSAESVNGNNTLQYLDSNFVVVDSADATKFYKYKPVVTNGVITSWNLTPVS